MKVRFLFSAALLFSSIARSTTYDGPACLAAHASEDFDGRIVPAVMWISVTSPQSIGVTAFADGISYEDPDAKMTIKLMVNNSLLASSDQVTDVGAGKHRVLAHGSIQLEPDREYKVSALSIPSKTLQSVYTGVSTDIDQGCETGAGH